MHQDQVFLRHQRIHQLHFLSEFADLVPDIRLQSSEQIILQYSTGHTGQC